MADLKDYDGVLRKLFPAPGTADFFGTNRSYVFGPTPAQIAWRKRGLWQRARDWLQGREEPPGPRLSGFRVVSGK